MGGNLLAVTAQNDADGIGAVYVFHRDGPLWIEEAKLVPFDGVDNAGFGYALAIGGDDLFVGSINDQEHGSVYVFHRNRGEWNLVTKLAPADVQTNDGLGSSVAARPGLVAIGSPANDARGINAGAAYVFEWNGAAWIEAQKLVASDALSGDIFGAAIALSGDALVLDAYGADPRGVESGAAYVFRQQSSTWIEEAKLVPTDGAAGDSFGFPVAVHSDVIAVGAVSADDNGISSGAAYAFRRVDSRWVEEQKLLASDGAMNDVFGNAVAVSSDAIVVGSPFDTNENGKYAGSAYVFRSIAGAWVEDRKLTSADGVPGQGLGVSLGMEGNALVVGAPYDPAKGTGAGAAYAYDLGVACTASDINRDGHVNAADLSILLGFWGSCSGACLGDIDGDGIVDAADLAILLGNWTG
ncbi:MAG: hypothetical protein SGJ09_16410 [Phycisphaerae bacterium]|nr:hypothetical protein [Phycisphaerae bacterium]